MTVYNFFSGLLQIPEDPQTWFYVIYGTGGLYVLYWYTTSVLPMCHPGFLKSMSDHKKAEAERIEVLERMSRGLIVNGDSQDIENARLTRPLLPPIPSGQFSLITISLSSGGSGAPLQVREVMTTLSATAAYEEFVDSYNFCCTSNRTRLQTNVELQDGILDRLEDIVKTTTPESPNELAPVLQVDSWAVLTTSDDDEGVKLLRLPTDELPVILHAEYAAGLVTITGLNLEDADIFASAKGAGTVQLDVYRYVKAVEPGRAWFSWFRNGSILHEDIAVLPLRLASKDIEKVFIYATKKVHLGGDAGEGGNTVEVMSKVVHVLDSFWDTVVGYWMPVIVFFIVTVSNIKALLLTHPGFWKTVYNGGNLLYFLLPWTIILSVGPARSSLAEVIKYSTESIRWGFYRAFRLFFFSLVLVFNGPRLEVPKVKLCEGCCQPTTATAPMSQTSVPLATNPLSCLHAPTRVPEAQHSAENSY